MIKKVKKLFSKYKEIITYIIFGATTTLINWTIYVCMINIGASTIVANSTAWGSAVIYAFITNKLFVFESKSMRKGLVLKEGISFLLTRVFSGLIEVVGPEILMSLGLNQHIFGIKGAVAKFMISIIVIISNYVLSKLLVFRMKIVESDQ